MKLIGISGKIGSGKDTVGSFLQFLLDPKVDEDDKAIYSNYQYYFFTKIMMGDSPIKILKFADKIKDMVCVLINCTREQLEDSEFKNTPIGPDWVSYRHIYRPKRLYNTPEDAIEAYKDFRWHLGYDYPSIEASDIERVEITPRFLMQSLGTDWGRTLINPNMWVNSTLSNLDENTTYIVTDVRFQNEMQGIADREGFNIRIKLPKEPFYEYNEEDKYHVLFDRKDKSGILSTYGAYVFSKEEAVKHFKELMNKDTHQSEIELDDIENHFDIVLVNDGTKEDLFQKVYEFVYPLVKKL